ncbi:MAG: ribulokinase [Clostridia bacterium]|nr:ribulokinase [Clostridia bacterium]
MKTYVIGIDYGTLSGRCVVVDTTTGTEIAESVLPYPHAVMDEQLPSGERLPSSYALQHPQDYLDVLRVTIRDAMQKAGVTPDQIAGLGMDFTACTLLPVDKSNTPLCFLEAYRNEKHAYVKLWKHHAAQPEADEINALAAKRGESWLSIYGGKISCEWMLPKILETLRHAPEIYRAADRFIEAADWLSRFLTGEETHSVTFAGFKGLWDEQTGYPSNDFMTALDPRLDGIVGTKISTKVMGIGQIAGTVNARGAELTGLKIGTPMAIPIIDAHAAMPALNVTRAGDVMLIVGTSSCLILNADTAKQVDGICGYVKNSVIPSLYTYEAGQAGVGDIFDWFVKNCVPATYTTEANARGISIHKLLREKAQKLTPGESGLVALDWWSGNRSILVNSKLTGMILGMTLSTKPEEIYRALIEATAFGLKRIVEQFASHGITVGTLCAAGGIAQKDEMMMQIYADVLDCDIQIAATTQAGALGSAIYASIAAGIYPDIQTAAEKMSKPPVKVYHPIAENVAAYQPLYQEYKTLHDYFGKKNGVMERIGK